MPGSRRGLCRTARCVFSAGVRNTSSFAIRSAIAFWGKGESKESQRSMMRRGRPPVPNERACPVDGLWLYYTSFSENCKELLGPVPSFCGICPLLSGCFHCPHASRMPFLACPFGDPSPGRAGKQEGPRVKQGRSKRKRRWWTVRSSAIADHLAGQKDDHFIPACACGLHPPGLTRSCQVCNIPLDSATSRA